MSFACFKYRLLAALIASCLVCNYTDAQDSVQHVSADDITWQTKARDETTDTSAVDHSGDPLPRGALQRFGTTRYRLPSFGAMRMCFLADNRTLVLQGDDIRMFDAYSGATISMIELNDPLLREHSLAVSRNGRFMAVVVAAFNQQTREYRPLCKVWDTSNRRVLGSCSWDTEAFSLSEGLAISNDGTNVAVGGRSGALYYWKVGAEPKPRTYDLLDRELAYMRFSDDESGDLLVASFNQVAVWNTRQQEKRLTIESGFSRIQDVQYDPDTEVIVVADRGHFAASLYEAKTGNSIRNLRADGDASMRAVCYLAGGKQILTTSYRNHSLDLLDTATGTRLKRLDLSPAGPRGIAVSPDGSLLSATLGRCEFRVWRLPDFKELSSQATGHLGPPTALAFTTDGERFVTGGHQGTIREWDVASGELIRKMESINAPSGVSAVTSLDISRDGSKLLSAGFDDTLRLWDLSSGNEIFNLAGHGRIGTYGAHSCKISESVDRLFSFGPDFYFRAWDRITGKAVLEERVIPSGLDVQEDEEGNLQAKNQNARQDPFGMRGMPMISSSQISDDGKLLAFHLGKLILVDTATGSIRDEVDLGRVEAVQLGPDFNFAVVLLGGRTQISIRSLPDAKEILNINPTADSAHLAALSDDGRLLAVRLYERLEVRSGMSWTSVYDVATGKERYRIDTIQPQQYMRFSPDGARLAIGANDSSVVLFDLNRCRVE